MLIHDLTLGEVKAFPEAIHAFLTHNYACGNGHLFNKYEIDACGDGRCPCCGSIDFTKTNDLDRYDRSEYLGFVIANANNDEPYTKQHFDNMEKAGEL